MSFSHRLWITLPFLVSCGGSPEEPPLVLDGGVFRVVACGYDVTTTAGMSAPVLGTSEAGSDPTPHGVHLGLQGDPATSMVVQWRTRDETTLASTVELTAPGGAPQLVEGVTFVYSSGFGTSSPLVRVHETHLCGLLPDTEYSYRVGGAGTFSAASTFRTAPAATADEEVVVAVVGDTRNGYDVWAQVVSKLDEIGTPDLILFTGDAVTLGQFQAEWDEFFEVAEPLVRRVPMVFTMGNHEVNSPTYLALAPGRGTNASFDFGPAHVTVVDDNVQPATLAAAFLDSDLTAAAGRPWKLVMHHRASYSAAANHGSDETLRAAFGPIFDEHHVDLVLNGHDHDYERTHPMNGGAVAGSPAAGTVYLVSGGAGAVLYDPGVGFWTAISEKKHHFVLLRVRPGRLELRAYDTTGAMFDEQVITK